MHLDFRGQECPIPTVKTVELLKGLKGKEQAVTVVVDDSICAADIPHQASRLGYTATTKETGSSEWTILLTPASVPEAR